MVRNARGGRQDHFISGSGGRRFRRAPIVHALALAMAAGGLAAPVSAQASGGAWFAASGSAVKARAAQARVHGGIPAAQRQRQQAQQQLDRSIVNLGRTASAIAAQQAAMAAARAQAQGVPSDVPDGLVQGGLWRAEGGLAQWEGAKEAVAGIDNGRHVVRIEQTEAKAILAWESFNIGRDTTLAFQQRPTDAVLNKVVGADTRPSRIQGAIQADGTVMVVNQNGIVFSGTSQVNVRNLAAAATASGLTDQQFRDGGLYGAGTQPAFSDARGDIEVQAGARITTHTPGSVTQGGGYAMLLGRHVSNAGQIATPNGQALLGAGDEFVIRAGQGTNGNPESTTRGNEVTPRLNAAAASGAGNVLNTGLITAATGDITLTGRNVTQSGVVVGTTSTAVRGTVHLNSIATEAAQGGVVLAPDSVTAIVLDESAATALDSQREAGKATPDSAQSSPYYGTRDRRDLSRVQIDSGSTVLFQGGSLTLATGGQIAVDAAQRTLVERDAQIDVSGAVGVRVAMESNNLNINVQGNEQRDAPVNRDSQNLNNSDLWVDRRTLVHVPAGTNGYATDRWYTRGGLLEVSGYLATSGRTVGEWMAQGGTLSFSGGDLVTRPGSRVNLSGGTLDVQGGYINMSWLRGADGRLYEVSRAPADILYEGLYRGYEAQHARWGDQATRFFLSPLIGPSRRHEQGYTVGRDAGRMVVSTQSAVLEGDIVSEVYRGERQVDAPQADLDGYYQPQTAVARRGQLLVGSYLPLYAKEGNTLRHQLTQGEIDEVLLGEVAGIADGIALDAPVDEARQGVLHVDAGYLGRQHLGAVEIVANDAILVQGDVSVAEGGRIVLHAAALDVDARLSATAGSITLGNIYASLNSGTGQFLDQYIEGESADGEYVRLGGSAVLDVSGAWGNVRLDPQAAAILPFLDGGSVSIRSRGAVTLQEGSVVDVSSGAALSQTGEVIGGKGGGVTLAAGVTSTQARALQLDGTVQGYGVAGAGKLTIRSGTAVGIGADLLAENGVLGVGEVALANLTLTEGVDLEAGDILPADFRYTTEVAYPGQELQGTPRSFFATPITTRADWVVPAGGPNEWEAIYVFTDTFETYQSGQVVPAGTIIAQMSGVEYFPVNQGYIVPADVFPEGLPTQSHTALMRAGTPALFDLTLQAGAIVPAGQASGRALKVAPVLTLAPEFFQRGFAAYDVTGGQGLVVGAGTWLEPRMPVLQWTGGLHAASAAQALSLWTPPRYRADPQGRQLHQRAGADITLAAGTMATGQVERRSISLNVQQGAHVVVDPGQTVTLASVGQLTVDGDITAKGGRIVLHDIRLPAVDTPHSAVEPSQRAISIGGVLDVSGGAVTAPTRALDGSRYGTLYGGGEIVVGGMVDEAGGTVAAPHLFVHLREGAVLDARGASAEFDLPGAPGQALGSRGGSVSLTSANGLVLEGEVRLQGGGAGAADGALALGLEAPIYNRTAKAELLAFREMVISQGLPQRQGDTPYAYGQARVSADWIAASGADDVTLYSAGAISFDNDVHLHADQSVRLYTPTLALAESSADAARVTVSAAYVRLAGIADLTSPDNGVRATQVPNLVNPSLRESAAQFAADADLIDVRDVIGLGMNAQFIGTSTHPDSRGYTIDRRGFATAALASRGDLRTLRTLAAGAYDVTELRTPGDLTLSAVRIYPETHAVGRVTAGWHALDALPGQGKGGALVILRADGAAASPPAPYSAFGSLTLSGITLDHHGVVQAPLGAITLQALGTAPGQGLSLHAGSVTSASAQGLVMPYGGTVDGIRYQYGGEDIAIQGITGIRHDGTLVAGIDLSAVDIDVRQGATLDLSGGGTLAGAGFVQGRGGSTDARMHPLVRTTADGFVLPGLESNPVYAIVPGAHSGYAPVGGEPGAVDPMVGQTITIGAGVPGLAAGTYTLLPSSYALLPGAFRVELDGGAALSATQRAPMALRNGSWSTGARLGIANTGVADALARNVIVTSADVLRRYSQYNETSYSEFIRSDAARQGVPRGLMPEDGKQLVLSFQGRGEDETDGRVTFDWQGTAHFSGARGGHGGALSLRQQNFSGEWTDDFSVYLSNARFEILAAGQQATQGFKGTSVYADDLNAIGAPRMVVGASLSHQYGRDGRRIGLVVSQGSAAVTVRSGAVLQAPEVILATDQGRYGGIVVEAGAGINTVGQGPAPYDSSSGYVYEPRAEESLLAVSNGWLDVMAPPQASDGTASGGAVEVGRCDAGLDCALPARLHSEGTITIATNKPIELADTTRYGTRNLILAVGGINVGSRQALADAAARNILPPGLALNQQVLDRLLRGDQEYGAPALEGLFLTSRTSLNFYESITLSTLDEQGVSRLRNLVLTTPAIHGHGDAGDVARIETGHLIWTGSNEAAPAPIAGGAGHGAGRLEIQAERIEFGVSERARRDPLISYDRQALGFAEVVLHASDRVTSTDKGSLSVHQSRGEYETGKGFAYHGGALLIHTPVLTGGAGSELTVRAGNAIRATNQHAAAGADSTAASGAQALGARLSLQAPDIALDTRVVLPSGRLALTAADALALGDAAYLDMAGRAVPIHDLTQYSWGGDVVLESRHGNITQAAGSVIDLSARHNQGGTLKAVALDESAGIVDLQGSILGSASGYYDAGGTIVPYLGAGVEIRAQRLGGDGTLDTQFAALNHRLNAGEVYGSRSFQFKQGSLTVGDGVKANAVAISVDNGSLAVNGTIDASGERVGSIRLAGKLGLTIAGTALLDAHGAQLRLDSYGKIIDSPNRAHVELNSGDGLLTLASGARIDLRHGTDDARVQADPSLHDGRARGTLELTAPRVDAAGNVGTADAETYGDIAIEARGNLDIQGARSIAVNATHRYDDAPDGTDAVDGKPYQIIDQAYLDAKHDQSTLFIEHALGRNALVAGKLAGLNNATYRDAFHLRPGVEIVSRADDGNLVVQGDLDLSKYRYASLNPHVQARYDADARAGEAGYGSGEPGMLVMRAGGDLNLHGSITDGFTPLDTTVDTDGWILVPGRQPFDGDVVIPRLGIALQPGSTFPAGVTLNYDLPAQDVELPAGMALPVDVELGAALALPAGTVLPKAVTGTNAQGATVTVGAGERFPESLTLDAGAMLPAGTRLDMPVRAANLVWPAGVALPVQLTLSRTLDLKLGALIPGGSDIELTLPAGETSIPLGTAPRRNWAVAPLLPAQSLSWAMRLVAGADMQAADTRMTKAEGGAGHLVLADTHHSIHTLIRPGGLQWVWTAAAGPSRPVGTPVPEGGMLWCELFPNWCIQAELPPSTEQSIASVGVSFVRTGTGDLDVAAAGDIDMRSPYGVYTAGADSVRSDAFGSAAFQQPRGSATGDDKILGSEGGEMEALAASVYRAWYPESGGNVTVAAGRDLLGEIHGPEYRGGVRPQLDSSAIGNWLWRQGTGTGSDADPIPTAWWINYGSYSVDLYESVAEERKPFLTAFTGIGALGGGNIDIGVGRHAGAIDRLRFDIPDPTQTPRSDALVVAIGGTGRVLADGTMALTGGGDLSMRVGGSINTLTGDPHSDTQYPMARHDLQGKLVNLRGHVSVRTGALGTMGLHYARGAARDVRLNDPYASGTGNAFAGITLAPGDSTFTVSSAGDLILGAATDPGRVAIRNSTPFTVDGTPYSGGGLSSFSLWTRSTAIDLFSAGGNVAPSTQLNEYSSNDAFVDGRDYSATDGRFVYPARLSAVAASGSLYLGTAVMDNVNGAVRPEFSLLLAPHAEGAGRLMMLAGDTIYGAGYPISRSGAGMEAASSPLRPAFTGLRTGATVATHNYSEDGMGKPASKDTFALMALGADTNAGPALITTEPGYFYAGSGDIIGLMTGERIAFGSPGNRAGQTWYEAAGPVRMVAGGDIVGSGSRIGEIIGVPAEVGGPVGPSFPGNSTTNLIVHSSATDVSVVQAGGDIIHSSFQIAGPGVLEITAGGSIRMDDQVAVTSLGPVNANDPRPGASIVMQAGMSQPGGNYAAFLEQYMNPANRIGAGALADQPGKVVHTYEQELLQWLSGRYGFAGTVEEARAYLAGLAPEQQRIFARHVFYAELREGGREYNDADGPRFGSYLRGRNAIAALFPAQDAQGQAMVYDGDITMYDGAGVHTYLGGDIQMLTPGGAQTFGLEGEAPPSSAGVITQGLGNIQLYSLSSILLGQSRIMTTFGGSILAWSAQGDINAGRGSKTTVVYTPPRREYDDVGNVTLSPNVPSTGAGIATLNPIPEVEPGDVDLIAPLGTIDAGEAGIRVSGNVNIAALQVVNAANIQVQGESQGIPVAAVVNTGALANASAAATSAATAAQDAVSRSRAAAQQALPSIVSVQILGFGSEQPGAAPRAPASPTSQSGAQPMRDAAYDPASPVQFVAVGADVDPAQAARLSAAQQRQLRRD